MADTLTEAIRLSSVGVDNLSHKGEGGGVVLRCQ